MANATKTFVQFGAGNIGRSFIGRLFAEAGYRVVFIDVDSRLVSLLNERRSYPVVVKQNDRPDQVRLIGGVSAIDGRDREAVIDVLTQADGMATSVGQRGLQAVLPLLAAALELRAANNAPPLDLIIAENLRSGAAWFRQNLGPLLPEGFDLDSRLGLVETSIGKMVPIMPQDALNEDPLQLFAEPYDTLIVDRLGFRREVPALAGLKPVNNIAAWVDRKLFLHNMSHAALAYLGYQANPALIYCWQAMELPAVVDAVRAALLQSAAALNRAYPDDLSQEELAAHADDLLNRYRNRALGDTLHRVGRDLGRKLAREDRLIGACLLAAKHGLPFDSLVPPIRAALKFAAPDEQGRVGEADQRILQAVAERGPRAVLCEIAGLDAGQSMDQRVLEACFPE
jgi:mannitol-1-phosphate 5-dehydrogenase